GATITNGSAARTGYNTSIGITSHTSHTCPAAIAHTSIETVSRVCPYRRSRRTDGVAIAGVRIIPTVAISIAVIRMSPTVVVGVVTPIIAIAVSEVRIVSPTVIRVSAIAITVPWASPAKTHGPTRAPAPVGPA